MSWIKMKSNLQTHPKVAMIAARLRVPVWAAVGALHAVWSAADQHTEDGTLDMNAACLDALTGIKGISAAMLSVGWLVENGDSMQIPAFEEHQGQSAKRRAVESVRKMSARDADTKRTKIGQNAHLEGGGRSAHLEKEKEKDKNKTEEGAIAPVSGEAVKRKAAKPPMPEIPPSLDCANFRAEWVKWLAYRSSKGKPVSPAAATEQFALCQELGPDQAVIQIRDSIRNDWQGLFKPKETNGRLSGAGGFGGGTAAADARRADKAAREFPEPNLLADLALVSSRPRFPRKVAQPRPEVS